MKRDTTLQAFTRTGNNKSKAARPLGLTRAQLRSNRAAIERGSALPLFPRLRAN